ncbi:hypothetical protein ACLX1H_000379 [Fusarium chlamydosporum]
MQFSIATVIAAMASFRTASADWTVIAFSDENCALSGKNPNALSRTLYSTVSNSGPCIGDLIPASVYAAGDCVFFDQPACGGSEVGQMAITWRDTPICVSSYTPVRSFQC